MVKLTISDQYQIKNELEINYNQLTVLTRLYLPIIGKNAYVLYLTLHSESDLNKIFTNYFNITRLSSITDLTIDQLKEAFTTLEGIGLLRTYVKYNDINYMIFELHSPVSAKVFFQNQIFNVLLYRTLKKEEYVKTKYMFLTKEINLKDYEEVTSSFDDAFYFNYDSSEGNEAFELNEIRDNSEIEIKANYDLSVFYKNLSSMQIRRDIFKEDDLLLISQLGSVYGLDGTTMSNLVIECLEANHLDQEKLKEKARIFNELDGDLKLSSIYRTQPYDLRVKSNKDDPYTRKIKELESLSPYKLIEAKFQSTPLNSDLQFIEKCMLEDHVPAGVMNVLLETCWVINDNKLVPNYIRKIAKSWMAEGITTVEEAMNKGTELIRAKKNPEHTTSPAAERKSKPKRSKMSEEERQKLKERIRKEGL